MTIRTSKKTVIFERPFVIGGFDEALPAGTYTVERDEELLEGISFPAYRHKSTLIHLLPDPGRPGLSQKLRIDVNELAAALIRDQTCAEGPADSNAKTAPEIDGQLKEKRIDAQSFLALVPAFEGVAWDPIVRLIMRRDGLSEATVWDMIKPVQMLLGAQSVPKTVKGAAASHGEALDHQVIELPTMRGR